MNRTFVFLFASAMVLGFYVQTHATLVDRGADSLGNHLIYDSDLKITWYDFPKSSDIWQKQVDWAASLTVNFGGNIYDNWRLPATVDGPWLEGFDGTTTGGYNITSSEMGHLFYTELKNKGYYDTSGKYVGDGNYGLLNKGPFTNLGNWGYFWSGTEYSSSDYPNRAWDFSFYYGYQAIDPKSDPNTTIYALAVRPGDVAVPEPATMLLLCSGLIGLAGYGRKKFFKK